MCPVVYVDAETGKEISGPNESTRAKTARAARGEAPAQEKSPTPPPTEHPAPPSL